MLSPTRTGEMVLLHPRVDRRLLRILATAGKLGDRFQVPVYAVGGWVRDLLLQRPSMDLDLTVEGDGLRFAGRLAQALGGKVAATHPRFGTARVDLADGLSLDVATARSETYAHPAALPRVRPAGLKDDLQRRDFTLNAMAVQLNPEGFGRLIDLFGGLADINRRQLRVLHSHSFIDDPTRIFRAARFGQRLGFTLEPESQSWLHTAVRPQVQKLLSGPRLLAELWLVLAEPSPEACLRQLSQWGVLAWLHPALRSETAALRWFNAVREQLAFAENTLKQDLDRAVLYALALFDALTPAQMEALIAQPQFPKQFQTPLVLQRQKGEAVLKQLETLQRVKPSQVVAWLDGLPLELILFFRAKTQKKPAVFRLDAYLQQWRWVEPSLTGKDLKTLGYTPGPQYTHLLRALRNGCLDGQLKHRADELRFLETTFPPKRRAGSPVRKKTVRK